MSTATRPVWTAPEGHVILSAKAATHRVSSDHAWIDSGTGIAIATWDGTEVHNHYINTGWGDGPNPEIPEPNATPRDYKLAAARAAAGRFASGLYEAAEKAHCINVGGGVTTVRIVKGRKAPKGEYEVVRHAIGNFGPYVNLRSRDGKFYSYVAIGNVEVVPDYTQVLKDFSCPEWVKPFLADVLTNGSDGLKVLADAIEDREQPFLKHAAADFANALRNVMAGKNAPKLSTYHADCHNEFRRPFQGI